MTIEAKQLCDKFGLQDRALAAMEKIVECHSYMVEIESLMSEREIDLARPKDYVTDLRAYVTKLNACSMKLKTRSLRFQNLVGELNARVMELEAADFKKADAKSA